MTCPSFEDLSQFVDGELPAETHADLAAHIDRCTHCAALVERLASEVGPFGGAANGRSRGGTSCLSPESAVAYVLGGAGAGDTATAAHLRQCDACVEQVAAIHRLLRRTAEVAAPVPEAVDLRARAAACAGADAAHRARLPRVSRVLTRLTRLPVLIPTALAAGALFTVAVESQWPSAPPRQRLRSLPSPRTVEVTAEEAPLRSRPEAGAPVVATARRGDVLESSEEQQRWYRVALSDGREGWIERHACE